MKFNEDGFLAEREKPLNLNPKNINEAKAILKRLQDDEFLKKIQQNPMETIASIKELKASGFFNLSLPEKDKPGKPFKVTLRDIEEVFKMINPATDGKKVMLTDLKQKVPMLIPTIPVSEIYLLTNNKTQITSQELYSIL